MREAILCLLLTLSITACQTVTVPNEPTDVATIRGEQEQTNEPNQEQASVDAQYRGQRLAGTTTPYLTFTKEDYETALKTKRVIVLDYYANWCPICKQEEPEILAAFNQLNLPETIGFRINYKDSETDTDEDNLARQHGIAYQHTKIILVEGKQTLKSPESWDKERWIAEITKATND